MALYATITGTITGIDTQSGMNGVQKMPCEPVVISLMSEEAGPAQILLPSTAYVLNFHPFQIGERVTFFYDGNAAIPLIYPPRYTAIAAAYVPHGMTAVLEYFDSTLTNEARTLTLTPAWNTPVTYANGQAFAGNPGGNLLFATYSASTKSIPAQAMPEQIVVFCGS